MSMDRREFLITAFSITAAASLGGSMGVVSPEPEPEIKHIDLRHVDGRLLFSSGPGYCHFTEDFHRLFTMGDYHG